MTEEEAATVREAIDTLAGNGRLNEAIELEDLLLNGKIKIDDGMSASAMVRWGVLFLNPNEIPALIRGKTAKANEFGRRQYRAKVHRLSAILLHEQSHLDDGYPFFWRRNRNERDAYDAEMKWIREMLNRCDLPEEVKGALQDRLNEAKENRKD